MLKNVGYGKKIGFHRSLAQSQTEKEILTKEGAQSTIARSSILCEMSVRFSRGLPGQITGVRTAKGRLDTAGGEGLMGART
jgi:hypothetical protein